MCSEGSGKEETQFFVLVQTQTLKFSAFRSGNFGFTHLHLKFAAACPLFSGRSNGSSVGTILFWTNFHSVLQAHWAYKKNRHGKIKTPGTENPKKPLLGKESRKPGTGKKPNPAGTQKKKTCHGEEKKDLLQKTWLEKPEKPTLSAWHSGTLCRHRTFKKGSKKRMV